MQTYIALLRGINVGGKNKLPMAEFRTLLAGLDLARINTYIQSGNVVFQSATNDVSALSVQITQAIERQYGFAPYVFLIDVATFIGAAQANPYPEAEAEPKTLHLFFVEGTIAEAEVSTLESLRHESERFTLINQVIYLHAPEGIGRSKLAEKLSRGWRGVVLTGRNWRTISKVMDMAQASEA